MSINSQTKPNKNKQTWNLKNVDNPLYSVFWTGSRVISISDDQLKKELSITKSYPGMSGYRNTESHTIESCATGHYKLSSASFGDKCKKCPPGEYTLYANNNVLSGYTAIRSKDIPGIARYYITELHSLETCTTGHYKLSRAYFRDTCPKSPPSLCTLYSNNNVYGIYHH